MDEWSEPAWFAEQARQREEVRHILQDCMANKGWDAPVDEYGGIDTNLGDLPDQGESMIADMKLCYDLIPNDYAVTVDAEYLQNVLYPQQVDTYNCLVAQGVEPSPPPPADIWVEAMLSPSPDGPVWLPWDGTWVEKYTADGSHTYEDVVRLEQTCPQPYIAPQ